ncbi:3D domain-containing protein [Tistrella bauzanensis]
MDRAALPLGAPVWLDTTYPDGVGSIGGTPLRRLMVAQDTGGAIKGAVRGDVFWGPGDFAELVAGRMKQPGGYTLLLPLAIDPQAAAAEAPPAG